jgi:hypothetical protein
MTGQTATIARYALTEARRSALPWLALACLAASLGVAGFLSQVAITGSAALQASVCAALLRGAAIFLVAAHVCASIAREANDKGLELAFALPLPRPAWYLGKLLGFAGIGAAMATLFALPLLAWAKPQDLAAWWLALAAETALVAAAALFFATALGQTVAAISATLALYLLARAVPAMQAIAGGPLADDGAASLAARWLVDAFALLLPRLDAVAVGDWLLYGAPSGSGLAMRIGGLAIYFVLLAAAGMFDLSRRNL